MKEETEDEETGKGNRRRHFYSFLISNISISLVFQIQPTTIINQNITCDFGLIVASGWIRGISFVVKQGRSFDICKTMKFKLHLILLMY